MNSAVLMSFSSKIIMWVEGCHGDSFAIFVDRHQRWALTCIIPYCDMPSHQDGGDCIAVCVCIGCVFPAQVDIYYLPWNQEKASDPPAFCYLKVTHWCCFDGRQNIRPRLRDCGSAGEKNGHIAHTRVSEAAAETVSGGWNWSQGWQLLYNFL